jgi:integrase
MTNSFIADRGVAPSDHVVLRAAASAYLGRYRGASRLHTDSDLRIFLNWCADQDLDPLTSVRADIERYVRWLQDVRRYQPSTVSRRLSVVVGFYRVCVIDQILAHSPADYVRRPVVPPESPTLGLGHLQFEALITTARLSHNLNDFALIALLGLLGLRIFEACGANIGALGEEHGHRVLRVRGKGGKVVLVPLPPAVARAIDRRSTTATPARSCGTPSARGWTGMQRPAGSSAWPRPPPELHPRRLHGRGNVGERAILPMVGRCVVPRKGLLITFHNGCLNPRGDGWVAPLWWTDGVGQADPGHLRLRRT